MFRYELSSFLKRVLDAIDRLPDGVLVDSSFEPEERHVGLIAVELDADQRDVREALMGLEAGCCLVQETLEIPGIEAIHTWKVHPQCRAPQSRSQRERAQSKPSVVREDCR